MFKGLKSIGAFLNSFVSNWLARMSGGFSVPFALFFVFWSDLYVRVATGALAILCFFVCAYSLWRKERQVIDDQNLQLEQFKQAWDRTGKYTIPLKEALVLISNSIRRHEEATLTDKNIDLMAVAKFRSIGWNNPCHLTGHKFISRGNFHAIEQPIPPGFWEKNTLNLEAIKEDMAQLPQTFEDGKYAFDTSDREAFGQIKINKSALISMFPQ